MPRVLIINPNFEDYLSDGVLHGLRALKCDVPGAEWKSVQRRFCKHLR